VFGAAATVASSGHKGLGFDLVILPNWKQTLAQRRDGFAVHKSATAR